jgi:uncharacterized protein (TIGR02001 family)
MRTLKILTATCLLGAAAVANAGISSTWTATNDYDFRGFTQTAKDPALQGSLDYAHDSGFYAGLWLSNVKFAETGYKGNLEHDLYLGFTNKFAEDWTYDVGVIDYTYNQHVFDYQEIYASLAYGWFKGKVFYSPDYGGDTTSGNTSGEYVQVDMTTPLPQNFSVLAHVGYSWGDYWKGIEYTDYSVGVGYTAGKFSLALKYIDTDTTKSKGNRITGDVFNNEGRVVFTVATTFPW